MKEKMERTDQSELIVQVASLLKISSSIETAVLISIHQLGPPT
jgi:hypothetical protein